MVLQKRINQALTEQPVEKRNPRTVAEFKQAVVKNLYYERGKAPHTASPNDVYTALSLTIRDFIVDEWRQTVDGFYEQRPKFVYYLSAEYLLGQQITQNLLYTSTTDLARQALAELGFDLDELINLEPEPALGNGGLGRLAACYLDSLSTLRIPTVAYGIHYEFGIFQQVFRDGWQHEVPDEWLYYGNPWEFPQPDHRVEVGFGGRTEYYPDGKGSYNVRWIPAETVLGEPSHILSPGYGSGMVNMLRLWRAKASKEFDFHLFNVGDYSRAAEQKIYSENITKVLYPNDNTPQGRELRLKQQYFFVSCSLQDIIRRFLVFNKGWHEFNDKVVIQLNDTHPVVAIPELMRLLLDEHNLSWTQAWNITRKAFGYTCHTLLPEALEKWPVSLFERLLPRHMEIIYEINRYFLESVRKRFPDQPERMSRMSIIEDGTERMVRMAYLATAVCFSVNGVAELHTELLKKEVLRDFYEMSPGKFNNKTNGVSPRRFVRLANPRLSALISEKIGECWVQDMELLHGLEAHAEDQAFSRAWREIKRQNKVELSIIIQKRTGISVDPDSLFDVMVKRLHEYKRQMLKVLHIVTLYQRIKANPKAEVLPRTFIFGAKAAPGYQMAKLIIKLINSVGEVVNRDPEVRDRLKVVFLPNFNVTLGEKIYPAAELSEQISLAGKEASGTGNMKFALNGALTIGTLDGANVEIRDAVGAENFFLFGLTTPEVASLRSAGYNPMAYYHANAELRAAIDAIAAGQFSNGDLDLFRPLVDHLLQHDTYMLLADYAAYLKAQEEVEKAYRDPERWTHLSILNAARCGFFSSDRAMQQYCQDVWKIEPLA